MGRGRLFLRPARIAAGGPGQGGDCLSFISRALKWACRFPMQESLLDSSQLRNGGGGFFTWFPHSTASGRKEMGAQKVFLTWSLPLVTGTEQRGLWVVAGHPLDLLGGRNV